jgi:hypothetical protein
MPRILLLNPPIYDFCAYDFWLKPYGLLRVAGMMRERAETDLFDYLDRCHSRMTHGTLLRSDRWGRGAYRKEPLPKPVALKDVRRRFSRFGLPREAFREFLAANEPYDAALIQTGMTYWYPGVREALEDIRARSPKTRIVLGGVYASLCPEHAAAQDADLVIRGSELKPLWDLLGIAPPQESPAWWEGYRQLRAGVLKLSDGCPFRCTYCASDRLHGGFTPRRQETVLAELNALTSRGVRDIAFYDDALLYRADDTLLPFLDRLPHDGPLVRFHTPNALHARFITADVAKRMVDGGFQTFYLGLESASAQWQEATGRKVTVEEFRQAVTYLREAGAEEIHAYVLLGHPSSGPESVSAALRFAQELRVRVMLAEFSPVPGTPDGDACASRVDLREPLNHNKTAFPIRAWGDTTVNRLKSQCRSMGQLSPL